jgi:hypothetical protein
MANIGWNADLAWGENDWGDLSNASVTLSGVGLTINNGSVVVEDDIQSGWGRVSWGENAWGILGDVLLTGNQINLGTGTVTADANTIASPNGLQLNLDTGDPFIIIATEIFQDGIGLVANLGTLDPAPDAEVTGSQINLAEGSVTIDAEINRGWGRLTWGQNDWGTYTLSVVAEPTGQQLNLSTGTAEGKPNTIAEPSGIGLTSAEGTVDPSPDATVTGIGMTVGVGLGSVAGEANVDLTGSQVNIAQGTAVLDAVTIASLSGLQLNTTLANAVAGASAEVDLTGVQVNIALGNENIQSWQIVDTGTTVSYTEVSTGSSVSWNDIDTAA